MQEKKSTKKRLDVRLTETGAAASREKARALIMAGLVYVNDQKEDKPGAQTTDSDVIEVRGKTLPYVSRGGLKLEKALQSFPIRLEGRICVDIGASTGGFTDCMLQNGAAGVYAVDVGYGQLDWKLRNDPRVVCMEKTNFRYVKPEDLDREGWAQPSFASVDVSFISLSKILPPAFEVLSEDAELVCLVKPQFEAGREKVGKKGVVRDPSVHREVLSRTAETARELGFRCMDLSWSPIRGPEGNIEYLLYLKKERKNAGGPDTAPEGEGTSAAVPVREVTQELISEVVRASHEELDR